MAKRRYARAASPEFRREVLRMVERGEKSIPEIEQDLGLTKGIVYRWVERYGNGLESKQTWAKKEVTQEEGLEAVRKEIKRLKRALAQAEEERDILKKAVRIFSREQR